MTLVVVEVWHSAAVREQVLLVLSKGLPPLVAECLNCGNGWPSPKDVRVHFSPESIFDVGPDLTVSINVPPFLDLPNTISERIVAIGERLNQVVPPTLGLSVLATLPPEGGRFEAHYARPLP